MYQPDHCSPEMTSEQTSPAGFLIASNLAGTPPDTKDTLCCSICLEVFRSPVTIPCGHSFCRSCILGHWGKENQSEYLCPQCRRVFSPKPRLSLNVTLAEMVKWINGCVALDEDEETSVSESESPPKRMKYAVNNTVEDLACRQCAKHGRVLEMYCRTEDRCICTECMLTGHRSHDVVLVEEEHKKRQNQLEEMQSRMQQEIQKKERTVNAAQKEIESIKSNARALMDESERNVREHLRSIDKWRTSVKQQIVMQERKAVSQVQDYLSELSEDLTRLRDADHQLRSLTREKDPTHFLVKWPSVVSLPLLDDQPRTFEDPYKAFEKVRSSVSLFNQQLMAVFGEGRSKISENAIHTTIINASKLHMPKKDIPQTPDCWTRQQFFQYACTLTLDPNTVHKDLLLSDDHKSATCTSKSHNYPNHQERFTHKKQVLCREGLENKCCYWEVEFEGEKVEIGLTYRGIRRGGYDRNASFGGNKMSWSLDCIKGKYSVCHDNEGIELPVTDIFKTIGVFLEYQKGILTFYGVSDKMTPLYRFYPEFTEPLYPGFWLGEQCTIKLCPLDVLTV